MTSQEILLGELDMYKDSLERWLKKLNQENEDLCHKFLLAGQLNKEELTERYYKVMKFNLSIKEHQFRQTLGKHIASLSQMMNKLAKIIDVTQTLECTSAEVQKNTEQSESQSEPELKRPKKRKLKIPPRDLSGIKELTGINKDSNIVLF